MVGGSDRAFQELKRVRSVVIELSVLRSVVHVAVVVFSRAMRCYTEDDPIKIYFKLKMYEEKV